MSDRTHSLVVALEKDMHDDDVLVLSDAIRTLRGVLAVANIVSDINSYMAGERARRKLQEVLMKLVKEGWDE